MAKKTKAKDTKTVEVDEIEQLEDALSDQSPDLPEQPEQPDTDDGPPLVPVGIPTHPVFVPPEKPKPDNPGDGPAAGSTFSETKKAADKSRNARIHQATQEMPVPAQQSDEDKKNAQRIDGLNLRLVELAEDEDKALTRIDEIKAETREIMAELYPHTVKSDPFADSVRSYIRSSQVERANRGAHPARLKELLTRAGMAPVDAAFQRARARGMSRPTRTMAPQGGKPPADQGGTKTPDNQG